MAEGFTAELENLGAAVGTLRAMSMDIRTTAQDLVGSDILIGPHYAELGAALHEYGECRDTLAKHIAQAGTAIAATADALAGIAQVYARADGQG